MWPILIVSIIALTVVLERIFWWLGRWMRRDPKRIEKVFTAIEVGDVTEASRLSRDSRDPVLRMMWNGLNHQHASLQGALQVAAGIEIKRAGRFLVVMDTLVTLAPLLGLLGTITGLMKSFSFLGNEELAVQAVTGGIAEALIATACGLGIAIFALVPFNFFTSRVSNLEFELQTAATNLEVMLEAQSKAREGVEIPGRNPKLCDAVVDLKVFDERHLAHTEKESADRDHSTDRHHVLSARQFHDGELEPGAHEGNQSQSAHRPLRGDARQTRLYQSLSRLQWQFLYFDKEKITLEELYPRYWQDCARKTRMRRYFCAGIATHCTAISSACWIILRSVGFYKIAFEIKSQARSEYRAWPEPIIIMVGPLLFKPSPKWHVWAAFGGALLHPLQRRDRRHSREPPPIDLADIPTATIEATLDQPPGRRTDSSAGRFPIPEAPPPPEIQPEFHEEQTPPPQKKIQKTGPIKAQMAGPPRPPGTMSASQAQSSGDHRPRPDYPYEARRQKITGSGVCVVSVDSASGNVTDATMAQSIGNPILDNSSVSAFRRWRFKPGTVSKVESRSPSP